MKKIKILVVDDNKQNLANAQKQFEGKNVELSVCPAFFMAVQALKSRQFDILLTDLMLPGEKYGISGDNSEIGKDTPYGLVLSILAKNMGVPHVAIVTDVSHHAGPIAWAFDELIGDNLFITGVNHHNKEWLEVAEKFLAIMNSDVKEKSEEVKKKTVLLVGNGRGVESWTQYLSTDFNAVVCNEFNIGKVAVAVGENNPDCIILCAEVGQPVNKHARELMESIVSIKKEDSQLIVTGFCEYDSPYYLRMPFMMDALIERINMELV